MIPNERSSPMTLVVRGLLLIAAAALALFNGSLWSPFFNSVAYILYLTTRGFPLMTAARASDAAPFVIAVLTLLAAGIPAAIYERIGDCTPALRFRSASGWSQRCC